MREKARGELARDVNLCITKSVTMATVVLELGEHPVSLLQPTKSLVDQHKVGSEHVDGASNTFFTRAALSGSVCGCTVGWAATILLPDARMNAPPCVLGWAPEFGPESVGESVSEACDELDSVLNRRNVDEAESVESAASDKVHHHVSCSCARTCVNAVFSCAFLQRDPFFSSLDFATIRDCRLFGA